MFDRLRRLGRDLTGRSDHVLIDLLLGQIKATAEGLSLAQDVAAGRVATGEARARMVEIEHRGDDHRAELVVELASVLSPPIDREDLFRLSRSVDDVLDNVRDLVNECDLYGISPEPLLDEPLARVHASLDGLRDAVAALLRDPASVSRLALDAKKNDIRVLYQEAVGVLLADDEPVTGLTMRRREVLRRVDVVGLRVGEAADALSDGAVKRSH